MTAPVIAIAFPNITPDLPDDSWMPGAACKGSDTNFFGEHKGDSAKAKKVCADCRFIDPCLEYALAVGPDAQHGVWGGLSADERRKMLRARRREGLS